MKLAGLFLVLFVGTASAQYAGPPGNYPVAPPPGAQVGVGVERVSPRAAMKEMLLERFDRNRDGRLDARERRHAAKALRRLAKRMARGERGGRGERLRDR
jgi:hypothetical protein